MRIFTSVSSIIVLALTTLSLTSCEKSNNTTTVLNAGWSKVPPKSQQTKIIYGSEISGWEVGNIILSCNKTARKDGTQPHLVTFATTRKNGIDTGESCKINAFDCYNNVEYGEALKKIINGEVILFNMDQDDLYIDEDDNNFIMYAFTGIITPVSAHDLWINRFNDILKKVPHSGTVSVLKALNSIDITFGKVIIDKLPWNKDLHTLY